MINHIGFYVEDLETANAFYHPLVQSFGYDIIFTTPHCIAYGVHGSPVFEIYTGKPKSERLHVAFEVSSKELVERFHTTALALGAQDNGGPGYRSYTPNYYAAFIICPNGHNLEAVHFVTS